MKKTIGFIFCILGLFSLNGTAQEIVETNFENNKLHDAVIYPNPLVGENLTVKSEGNIKKIEVVNVIGKLINRTKNENFALHELAIHLGKCDKGIYLVKVSFSDDKSIIKKLLVK